VRRRLLLSTCLIALVAVVVLGLPLGFVGTDLLHQRADNRLERRADAIALRLFSADRKGEQLTLSLIRDLLPRNAAVRLRVDGRERILGTPPDGDRYAIDAGDAGGLDVVLLVNSSARDDDVGIVWLAVAASGFAALLAAVVLAVVQSRRLAAPLESLADRVERVGHTDYDDRPVPGHVPEIERLHQALNAADRRIGELVRHEREFSLNASHQLRSPLTGLRLRLEELRRLAVGTAATEEADAALAQADRLTATIEHLEQLTRVRDDRPGPIDLSAVVIGHLDSEHWRVRYDDERRHLSVDLPADVRAHAHPESVRQILDVLLDNALAHGAGPTTVTLSHDGRVARLSVADEGPRIASSNDIFRRGVGHGSGIGLAVARDLARRAGGDLVLADGTTTRFEATFTAPARGRDQDASW
jgi:signal transduction histidine kinase